MFWQFWLLNTHSISISLHLCLFIGRPLAGYVCFGNSGCSISAPLAFPWICACLLAARALAGYAGFCASGCSISSVIACLLASL